MKKINKFQNLKYKIISILINKKELFYNLYTSDHMFSKHELINFLDEIIIELKNI